MSRCEFRNEMGICVSNSNDVVSTSFRVFEADYEMGNYVVSLL